MNVAHLLRDVTQPFSMKPTDSVLEAVRNMIDFDTGAIAVLDGQRRCIGIFSKKDLLTKVVAASRDPKTTPLREVMTTEIVTASNLVPVEECMRRMTEHRIRHLVLVDASGAYSGLIGLCDLLGDRIFELSQSVLTLESYFNDSPGG